MTEYDEALKDLETNEHISDKLMILSLYENSFFSKFMKLYFELLKHSGYFDVDPAKEVILNFERTLQIYETTHADHYDELLIPYQYQKKK